MPSSNQQKDRKMTSSTDKSDLLRRAFAAYFRSDKSGPQPDQPSQALSSVVESGGRTYVVLNNARGVLTVYRVRTDGVLKRLVRWPADISV